MGRFVQKVRKNEQISAGALPSFKAPKRHFWL
jgi:hypothetical protein